MIKKLLLALAFIAIVWWLHLFVFKIVGKLENDLWVVYFTFIPFIGAINGFRISRKWGGWKSVIGRSLVFLSLGSLGWAFGNFVWSYFNLVEKISIPYPSIADIGFFSIIPFWTLGMLYMIKVIGGKFAWRSLHGKIIVIVLPLIGFFVSYFLFLNSITLSGQFNLTKFLDIAYPLGDAITITTALIAFGVSTRMLGGRMRIPIIILIFGFFAEYFADFWFSYGNSNGIFYNGSWIDFSYFVAQFLVVYGIASFATKDI